MGFPVSDTSRESSSQGIGLCLGLLLQAAAGLTACSQQGRSSPSAMDQKVGEMMGRMGVTWSKLHAEQGGDGARLSTDQDHAGRGA